MLQLAALFALCATSAVVCRHLDGNITFKMTLCGAILACSFMNLASNMSNSTMNMKTEAFSFPRIMLVSMVWMTSIRACALILSPPSSRKSKPVYIYIPSELFWYILGPLQRSSPATPIFYFGDRASDYRRRFFAFILMYLVVDISIVFAKALISEVTYLYLLRCVAADEEAIRQNYLLHMQYTFVFAILTLSSTYMFDVYRFFVVLLTGGRFDVLPFNNYPFLASSVSEFWSYRYNPLVHKLLKDSVYTPLRELGVGRTVSMFAAFVVSGLLHLHVIHVVFGERQWQAIVFFLVQLIPMLLLDTWARKRNEYSVYGNAFTFAFMFLTLPLYLGTMLLHAPVLMMEPTPQVANVLSPLVDRISCLATDST